MTRLISALVLLPVVAVTIWLLPPLATVVLAEVILLVAVLEYAGLAAHAGIAVARVPVAAIALATAATLALAPAALPVVLMVSGMVIALTQLVPGRTGGGMPEVGAAAFALVYLAAPIGVLADLRVDHGREVVSLLLATVMASDTAQYYAGRGFGRRLLAPTISPKKTVEGAVAGVLAGVAMLGVVGAWWLPAVTLEVRLALGGAVATLGIVGDLFESRLKRASGVKDASGIIPGHGGVLDRIDGLVFATPVFYVAVRLAE